MAVSQLSEMMDLCVGKEPKPLYKSQLLDFNEIFLDIFNAFGLNPKNRLVFAHFHDTGETGNLRCDSLAVNRVWKMLAYYQLVQVRKEKEETGEVNKKTGKPKMRTLNIITPTKLGYEILQHGALIKVVLYWDDNLLTIGIGKPYPTFQMMWHSLDSMFNSARIAKTRKEKWLYEFRKFYPENIASKTIEEAKDMVVQWGRNHVATAPRRFRRSIKSMGPLEQDKNQKLGKWFA